MRVVEQCSEGSRAQWCGWRSAAVWLRGVRCRAGPALLVLAMLHSSCPHGMGAETTLRVSASECGWVGTRQWRSLAKYRLDLRGGAPDTDGRIAAIEAELARTQKNKATMGHLCALRARLAALNGVSTGLQCHLLSSSCHHRHVHSISDPCEMLGSFPE